MANEFYPRGAGTILDFWRIASQKLKDNGSGEIEFRDFEADTLSALVAAGLRIPAGAVDGYVLTSDALGNATWAEATGGSGGSEPTGDISTSTKVVTEDLSTGDLVATYVDNGALKYDSANNIAYAEDFTTQPVTVAGESYYDHVVWDEAEQALELQGGRGGSWAYNYWSFPAITIPNPVLKFTLTREAFAQNTYGASVHFAFTDEDSGEHIGIHCSFDTQFGSGGRVQAYYNTGGNNTDTSGGGTRTYGSWITVTTGVEMDCEIVIDHTGNISFTIDGQTSTFADAGIAFKDVQIDRFACFGNSISGGTSYYWRGHLDNFVVESPAGVRTSPLYSLSQPSQIKDVIYGSTTTIPAGTSIKVETRLSYDGGATWDSWYEIASVESAPPPGLQTEISASGLMIQVRQTLTPDGTTTPSIDTSQITGYYYAVSPLTLTKESRLTEKVIWKKTLSANGQLDTNDAPDIGSTDLSGYDHLIIRAELRSDYTDATSDNALIYFNGDTDSANYRCGYFYGSSAENGDPRIGTTASATSYADAYGTKEVIIHDYAGDKTKLALWESGFRRESSQMGTMAGSAHWEGNDAISRIQILVDKGTEWLAGSWVEVIGVKSEQVITNVEGNLYTLPLSVTSEDHEVTELIGTYTLDSDSANILIEEDFSTFDKVTIEFRKLSIDDSTGEWIVAYLNGDTGGDYYARRVDAQAAYADDGMLIGWAYDNEYSQHTIRFENINGREAGEYIRSISTYSAAQTGGSGDPYFQSVNDIHSMYFGSGDLTSISIQGMDGTNLKAGTTAIVYGVRTQSVVTDVTGNFVTGMPVPIPLSPLKYDTSLITGSHGMTNAVYANNGYLSNTQYMNTGSTPSANEEVWFQFDLEETMTIGRLNYVAYYADSRSYIDVWCEVSEDGTNWETVLNSPGESLATYQGWDVFFPTGKKMRFIKWYSKGSTANTGWHCNEHFIYKIAN